MSAVTVTRVLSCGFSMKVLLPSRGPSHYNNSTMLSSMSKNPKEAIDYKWPVFQKPLQEEIAVPNGPGSEGFTRFDPAQSQDKQTPKPIVRNAVFQDLKPIEP